MDRPSSSASPGKLPLFAIGVVLTLLAIAGYELARDGNSQIITAVEGGTLSSTITIDINDSTSIMNGEFRPMLPFSDGAVALYTGHLYLRDVADEATGDDAPYLQTLDVKAPASVEFALGDLRPDPEIGDYRRWIDPDGDGTYIYFSAPGVKIDQAVGEHMTAILDPGLPADVREQIQILLESMFDMLAEGYGLSLPWRPMIIVSWERGRDDARHWDGGVRPGIIYMTLGGGGWDLDNQSTLLDLAQFVGHEASHFWNGSLIHNRSGDDPWLHEGSADAIADVLLHRLGIIDSATLQYRGERAINHCLDTLRGSALSGAGRGVHYPCGHMMSLWSDAALGAADPFKLWAALLDGVGPSREYDADTYFAVLRDLGADPELVDAMEQFTANDSATQRRDIIAGFGRAGVTLTPTARPPAQERPRLAAKALVHLQSVNCGRASVTTREDHLTTYPLAGCSDFTSEAAIYGIAGQLVADGDRAYDRVYDACSNARLVKISGSDGVEIMKVACDERLPERGPWLRLR